jgi:hypothetical protein
VVGYPIIVEIRQRVVLHSVAVEIQANRIEPAVAVQIEVGLAVPDGRCAIVITEAVIHAFSDAWPPLGVPARLPPGQQLGSRLLGRQRFGMAQDPWEAPCTMTDLILTVATPVERS